MNTVIFDLDGTLLDTLGDLAEGVNFALRNNGLNEIGEETVRGYVGNGAKLLISRSTGEDFEDPLFKKCHEDFREYYFNHLSVKTKPYDGIEDVLKSLKARGFKTAILSNKPDTATKALSELYFGSLIDFAQGEKPEINKKPAPDGVYAVLKELGADKENTLYVGDSEVDIQTAKSSGLKCISCSWGFKGREFLLKNGAENIADKPKNILDFIDGK
ncbi:MAG: HAD-IA family hydrolase [Clostridiales bacterium]|nr:HAD-IA family hydrolase [Clostridiales bacterium]